MAKSKDGFTLVELIVCLVILAMLMAVAVPSLQGYIDKAKTAQIIVEASGIKRAAEVALTEVHAFNPELKAKTNTAKDLKINGEKVPCARIGNWMMFRVQNKKMTKNDTPYATIDDMLSFLKDNQKEYYPDAFVARAVLEYMESLDIGTAKYKFKTETGPTGKTVKDYCTPNNPVGIAIFYNADFELIKLEFARDGYLITIDSGFETVVEKNGRFLNDTGKKVK